jgi:hypothetical protein
VQWILTVALPLLNQPSNLVLTLFHRHSFSLTHLFSPRACRFLPLPRSYPSLLSSLPTRHLVLPQLDLGTFSDFAVFSK